MYKENYTRIQRNEGQHSTYKAVIVAIFITVSLIAIANIVCVLAMCYPDWFGIELTKNLSDKEIIEASLLSDCVAIIGLAVAVWTGLNIANSIEKREVDKLQQRVIALNEEITERKSQQNQAEKDRFMHELYATANDPSTVKLIDMFRELPVESNVPYLILLDIEQKFISAFRLHKSEFNQDENLCKTAEEGISAADETLKSIKDPTVKLYLHYRIADFHFYMGYCCRERERLEHFTKAIEIYNDVAENFSADIPNFVSGESYPNINYLPCKGISSISAYFCNAIGEAYSKIEQEKTQLKDKGVSDDELRTYGLKAIFYCAYANHLEPNPNSVYKRNLGCAIERMYGYSRFYEELKEIYNTALVLDYKNINNYKTLVSLYDKHVNGILYIESVRPSEDRKNRLCNEDFAYTVIKTRANKHVFDDIKDTLKKIHNISEQAKAIHSSESVGYQYDCIYYRDMCAIMCNHTLETERNGIAKKKALAKSYLNKAKENWRMLERIAPHNPMTEILKKDLMDLTKLC